MREALAERLLAEVMSWSPEDVARERPELQDLASYKYDEYQQFSTGMHFIESLAIWLMNFDDLEERQTAYRFVTKRLVFVSEAEMRHLVSLTYPDHIRPLLLRQVADELDLPDYAIERIARSEAFRRSARQSLFLGLSDGARIDVFRRMSGLSNEQVHGTYQLTDEKAKDMLTELRHDLQQQAGGVGSSAAAFTTLFLLDDFAGSGDSLLKQEDGRLKGKISKCLRHLMDSNAETKLLDLSEIKIFLVLYLATQQAFESLTQRLGELLPKEWPPCQLSVVHVLDHSIRVTPERDGEFDDLLAKYYDSSIMDRHLKKGGADVIHGYAECSLPLVLSHNTPNNSVHLLWAGKSDLKTKPLFPRVSRHRED